MRIAPLVGDFVVVEEPSLAMAASELRAEMRATAESSGPTCMPRRAVVRSFRN
jgi:hypothetical protein